MIVRRSFFLSIVAVLLIFIPLLTVSEGTNFHWLFQQPTYLIEKDTPSLLFYTCDTSKEACRVNFDFRSSVPTDEPSTHYVCSINFGFGITGEESKCNPNTVEFPEGSWDVHVQIKRIADENIVAEGNISIVHPDGSIDPLKVTSTKTWQSPSYLLGKEDTSLGEYSCDPEESECRINLLINPMLDGFDSSALGCEITADFEIVTTADPCNPNTSIVPVGDHVITVKILDKNKNVVLQTSTITINNPPPETIIDPTRVVTDISWQQPTYLLEKEDTSKSAYNCDSEKTECKANILVVPKLDGIESSKLSCRITTDFGIDEDDCNPDTFIIPSGQHELIVEILNIKTKEVVSTRKILLTGLSVPHSGGGSVSPVEAMNFQGVGISVQSGLDENFVCRTDICQVNFLAEVPPGAECYWDFGGGIFETIGTEKNCNPGYVKFPADANVTLTVIDPQKNSNTATKILSLYRSEKPPEPLVGMGETSSQITLQTKISPTKQQTATGIRCILGSEDLCSLNFTGEASIGAKNWYWDFGNGRTSEKENPGIEKFGPGMYHVRLRVSGGSDDSASFYTVEVVPGGMQKEPCATCSDMVGKLQIFSVLPNPPRADTVEWVEIKNISDKSLTLDACELADETKVFHLSGILAGGQTLRLRQAITGLSLGNSHEALTLSCGDFVIDVFEWDFEVPTNYILSRDVLYGEPAQATVAQVIDGDTVDVMIDGKKFRARLLGIDTPETVHPYKPIEKFGKEASEYTRRTLEGKDVWVTFDSEPIDHYGRRLLYIWQCVGAFSETGCTLFNAQMVSQGYGRMERRFSFRFFEKFDSLEKQAKEEKIGIWSDAEVAREMNHLNSEEREALTDEQQKEYLELQKELLESCAIESEECDEKVQWEEVTKNITSLNLRQGSSGYVHVTGRTWGDFTAVIEVYESNNFISRKTTITNELGEYSFDWMPEIKGMYSVKIILGKDQAVLQLEEKIDIQTLSTHFLEPFQAGIVLQGQLTANRWQENDVFHCRSRGSCSVNVTAESNRKDNVVYWWILPDGSVSEEKNPSAIKLAYGQYELILISTDMITGEATTSILQIDHKPIPKKAQKSTTNTKYTLDIKDVPQDKGGGVSPEQKNPLRNLGMSLAVLFAVSFGVYTYLKTTL